MSAMNFGQKSFTPRPPEKGSFPLDHEGECKKFMLKYMICLSEHRNENTLCRAQAKHYLECRMERQLMSKEEFANLGYSDLEKDQA